MIHTEFDQQHDISIVNMTNMIFMDMGQNMHAVHISRMLEAAPHSYFLANSLTLPLHHSTRTLAGMDAGGGVGELVLRAQNHQDVRPQGLIQGALRCRDRVTNL